MSRAREALKRHACLQVAAAKQLVEKHKSEEEMSPPQSADESLVKVVLAALATSVSTLDRTVTNMAKEAERPKVVADKAPATSPTNAHKTEMAALRKDLNALRKVVDHQSGLLAMLANQAVRFEIVRGDDDDITDVIRHPVGANG